MADKRLKYPVARTHQFIHHAPQFRPVQRGARRKGLLRRYESQDGKKYLEIALFAELDVADQDLLLCLLAMLFPEHKGNVISEVPNHPVNMILRDNLNLEGSVLPMNTLGAQTTAYELLTELGRRTGKSDYDWLEASLGRLARVNFKYRDNTSVSSFNLMSWSAQIDTETNRMTNIRFVVNPVSAQAVLSTPDDKDSQGYFLCHRGERAQLKSEESRALHNVLCGLVMPGKKRSLNVDMLADKVYARYDEELTDDMVKYRRKAIIGALNAIDALEYWSCETFGRGKEAGAEVKRKKVSG